MKPSSRRLQPSLLAAATLFVPLSLALPSLHAATKEWTPSGSSINLPNAGNWTPSGAPASSDEVLFATVSSAELTTGNTLNWGNLIWNTNTSSTIKILSNQTSNKVLTLTGGGGSAAAIAAGGSAGDLIVLGDDVTTGTLTISGTTVDGYRLRLSIGADGNFNVKNAGATLVLATDFYQADVNLTKTGLGTLTISASTNFSASKTFAISAGTVNANHTGALGSGDVSLTGGVLAIHETGVGSVSLKANKTFSMSSGILSFSFASPASHDQITSAGGGAFDITGGIIDLNNSISDYSVAYALFKDFASGSVSGLQFINYDSLHYTASLGNDGVLAFTSNNIPEPSTWAAMLGACALSFTLWRRRRPC